MITEAFSKNAKKLLEMYDKQIKQFEESHQDARAEEVKVLKANLLKKMDDKTIIFVEGEKTENKKTEPKAKPKAKEEKPKVEKEKKQRVSKKLITLREAIANLKLPEGVNVRVEQNKKEFTLYVNEKIMLNHFYNRVIGFIYALKRFDDLKTELTIQNK